VSRDHSVQRKSSFSKDISDETKIELPKPSLINAINCILDKIRNSYILGKIRIYICINL